MRRTLNWLRPIPRLTAWLMIAVGVALAFRLLWGSVALAVAAIILLALIFAVSIVFIAITALPFVAVAVHEGGHVIAGWLVGFRFQAVTVGSIRIERQGDTIRVRWRKRPAKRSRILRFAEWFADGSAESLPSDDCNLRVRIAVMTAGGPAANLLFGALCLSIVWGVQHPASGDSLMASVATFVLLALPLFGWVSLAVPVASLFVWRRGEVWSDAAILLPLLRGGENADLLCLRWALLGMAKNAVPVSQWPTSVIEKAAGISRGAGVHGLLIVVYRSLLGRGDVLGAGQLLTRVLTLKPSVSADLLAQFWCEAAYLAARYAGNPQTARSFLEKAVALHPAEGEGYRHVEIAVRIAEEEGPAAPDSARLRLKVVTRGRQIARKHAEDSWIQALTDLLSSTPANPPAEATPPALQVQPLSDPS